MGIKLMPRQAENTNSDNSASYLELKICGIFFNG